MLESDIRRMETEVMRGQKHLKNWYNLEGAYYLL